MPRQDSRADPARRARWSAAFDQLVATTRLTAPDFVVMCGWSASQAGRYHGGQIPHPTHVRRMAAVARRDAAPLLAAAGYTVEAEAAAAPPDAGYDRLQRTYDRVPPAKREVFLQVIERLADLA